MCLHFLAKGCAFRDAFPSEGSRFGVPRGHSPALPSLFVACISVEGYALSVPFRVKGCDLPLGAHGQALKAFPLKGSHFASKF